MTVTLFKKDFAEDKMYMWNALVDSAFKGRMLVDPKTIDEMEVEVVSTYSAEADPETNI